MTTPRRLTGVQAPPTPPVEVFRTLYVVVRRYGLGPYDKTGEPARLSEDFHAEIRQALETLQTR